MRASLPRVFGTEYEYPVSLTAPVSSASGDDDHLEVVGKTLLALCRRFFPLLPQIVLPAWRPISTDFTTAAYENSSTEVGEENYFDYTSFYHGFMDTLGGRWYIDHGYPENCSPETTDPFTLVAIESARDDIIAEEFSKLFRDDPQKPWLSKDVSDGQGHSQAAHRNFCISSRLHGLITSEHGHDMEYNRVYAKRTVVTEATDLLALFHVIEQVFTGAGKFSVPEDKEGGEPIYQISGRADFIEKLVGDQTVHNRPIINTRREPLADQSLYGRYHCICGDANRSDWSKIFRIGLPAIFLGMLQDGEAPFGYYALDPVVAIKDVSRDLSLRQPIQLMTFSADKTALSPLQIWTDLMGTMKKYIVAYSAPSWCSRVIEKADWVLSALEHEPTALARILDWKIKERLIKKYANKDPRGVHMNYQLLSGKYLKNGEPVDVYKMWRDGGEIETAIAPALTEFFKSEPPADSRAYFRGKMLEYCGKDIEILAGARNNTSWDRIVLGKYLSPNTAGCRPPRVLYLDDPLFLTKAAVGDMFNTVPETNIEAVLETLKRRAR